jgi:hypothetical protein
MSTEAGEVHVVSPTNFGSAITLSSKLAVLTTRLPNLFLDAIVLRTPLE